VSGVNDFDACVVSGDVLDLLAVGLTAEQVIEELAGLELEDIGACLRFASRRLGHPVLAA